jgi:anti-anti-sigma factor
MERHLTASNVSPPTESEGWAERNTTSPTPAAFNTSSSTQREPSVPSLRLANMRLRTHTLVLTGELNCRSAQALEQEIEKLCEEDVTGITLDLRKLDYIDSIGVAVIAFRWGLCKRRGYDFVVVPGSRLVHRALAEAGVSDLLLSDDDVAAPSTTRRATRRPFPQRLRAVIGNGREHEREQREILADHEEVG